MQCTIDYKLFVSTAWTSTACRQEKLRNKLLRSQIVWYLTIQVNIKFFHSPASLLPHAKIRPEIFIGQGWNRILTWSIIIIVFIYWAKILQSFPLKFIVCTTITGQYSISETLYRQSLSAPFYFLKYLRMCTYLSI